LGRSARNESADLEAELRLAVERQEFMVEYQPIIDLRSGGVVGAEALVRWRHVARGTVSPAEFLPVAEQTGLIVEIGRHVLARAVKQARSWQLASPRHAALIVSVNVSARQLGDPGLPEFLEQTLTEAALRRDTLTLEVTGRDARGVEDAANTLEALRGMGARIALDDFGVTSALLDAREFPIDVVKLDRRFVVEAAGSPPDASFVEALLGVAAARGLETVAKGVERKEVAMRLKALGCDLAQGYLYSKPLGPEGIGALLSRGRFGTAGRQS
jgi:EAL domain-containing protein (putative c-di-GMP-specific phosphodiesterase class I)